MGESIGQEMGNEGRASMLIPDAQLPPQLHVFTNLETLWTQSFFFFFFFLFKWRLHYIVMID